MNTKLITALRATASAIEAGTFSYNWKYLRQCNCGSLFCALTGKSAAELTPPASLHDKPGFSPTWTDLVGQHCPVTGMPTEQLFKQLLGHGLTQQDIINLEYIRDQKVIARMRLEPAFTAKPVKRKWYQFKTPAPKLPTLYCQNGKHVAAYMRAWADLLTEEGAADVVSTNKETNAIAQ